MDQGGLHPQTEYPGSDRQLPSDLTPTAALHYTPGLNLQALNQITLSNLETADASQFGRQAQAVALLDQLMAIMLPTTSSKEIKLADLTELDSRVRTFLEVVMAELEERQAPICVPISLCVR